MRADMTVAAAAGVAVAADAVAAVKAGRAVDRGKVAADQTTATMRTWFAFIVARPW